MHHRRRGLTGALAALLLLVALTAACSDDGGSGASGKGADGSGPTSTHVPGGPSLPGAPTGSSTTTGAGGSGGPGGTTTTSGSGDPSEGIPLDQFCRGYAEVRGSQTAMADAVSANDIESFKTAYNRLTDAYLAIAENPPDEVYDAVRAVYFAYDDLSPQVAEAQSPGDLTALALQLQGGEQRENLEKVRDFGTTNC